LAIYDSMLDDADFRNLDAMPNLQYLWLVNHAIGDETAEWAAACTNLKFVVLDATELTDVGLSRLASLTHLEGLSLSNCDRITVAGVGSLAQNPELESIKVPTELMTDEMVEVLRTFPHLEQIHLSPPLNDPELKSEIEREWKLHEYD
jgi:hypothetical protein